MNTSGTAAVGGADGRSARSLRATLPDDERCIWPGCTRPRAPGRAAGSGRQKEYCLRADALESGGGPVHNARNRWAALRSGAAHRTGFGPAVSGEGPGGGLDEEQGHGGGPGAAAAVRDPGPVTAGKRRAGELLEQARRQHAASLDSLRAERELYAGIAAQLAALADPAALDLEIATIASRAGRELAQAAEEAARARRAQVSAERERDEAVRQRAAADAAAEQLTEDAEAAERTLAEQTEGFERHLADLIGRARAAEEGQRAAADEASAALAAAQQAVSAARERAEQATAALADALRSAEQARHAAEAARLESAQVRERAERDVARARDQAATAVAAAEDRAVREAAAAQARADDFIAQARADAERERAAADAARESARAAHAAAATAAARAAAVDDEASRLRTALRECDEVHDGELARLSAAHQAALDAGRALLEAERGRARRAEAALSARRPESGGA